MSTHFLRHAYACIALFICSTAAHAADQQHHMLWSLQGKTNKVYLLGSMHLLKESEKLPAAIDSAYADADALIMELDMDDLDPQQMQQAALELAMQPEGRTLQQQLGPKFYEQFAAKTRALGIEPAMLD
ncbi:MAG TPA: TraB/GumN family protein, partial [Herpetosiphonaceae bacterium]